MLLNVEDYTNPEPPEAWAIFPLEAKKEPSAHHLEKAGLTQADFRLLLSTPRGGFSSSNPSAPIGKNDKRPIPKFESSSSKKRKQGKESETAMASYKERMNEKETKTFEETQLEINALLSTEQSDINQNEVDGSHENN